MKVKGIVLSIIAFSGLIQPIFAEERSPNVWELSYSGLAKVTLGPALGDLEESIRSLGSESLPHETKDLRKKIVEVRDYLDLFSYSFSFEAPYRKQKDAWNFVRDGLDEGYWALGQFKDLFDSQELPPYFPLDEIRYKNRDLLKKRRKSVLEWKDQFYSQLYPILSNPRVWADDGFAFSRPDGVLSRFYWSKETVRPLARYSGLENLGRLARALLDLAGEEQVQVLKSGSLLFPDNEIIFHDFRKRVRVVIKVSEYFPDLLSSDAEAQDLKSQLKALVSRYGELNDRLTAYHLAEGEKKKKEAERIGEVVRIEWKTLKTWQKEQGFPILFTRFSEKIRKGP